MFAREAEKSVPMTALRFSLVLLAAFVLCGSSVAVAGSALMSTNGIYEFNAQKAGMLGHTVTTASLAQINSMTQEMLAAYDMVFVSPGFGSIGYDDLRSAVVDGGSLQLYVATGGTLVLNVAGNYGDQDDIAPGGVSFDREPMHNGEAITSWSHPYITGAGYGGHTLGTADFANWNETDQGQLTNLAPETTTILATLDGPSLVEYPHSDGIVLVSTLTVGWAEGGEARGTAQDNMINYAVAVPEPTSICLLIVGAAAILTRQRRLR